VKIVEDSVDIDDVKPNPTANIIANKLQDKRLVKG
jgi:hypothetical protein